MFSGDSSFFTLIALLENAEFAYNGVHVPPTGETHVYIEIAMLGF